VIIQLEVEGFSSGVGVTADAFGLASAFFSDGGDVDGEKNAELALGINTFRAGCSRIFKKSYFFCILFTP
jgi:hypothetical protein